MGVDTRHAVPLLADPPADMPLLGVVPNEPVGVARAPGRPCEGLWRLRGLPWTISEVGLKTEIWKGSKAALDSAAATALLVVLRYGPVGVARAPGGPWGGLGRLRGLRLAPSEVG